MNTTVHRTIAKFRRWRRGDSASEVPPGTTETAEAMAAAGDAPPPVGSHHARSAGMSLVAIGDGLRILREGLLLVVLCACGYGFGFWLIELRADLKSAAKAITSATHLPSSSSSQAPVPVVDQVQLEGQRLEASDTDALSERDLLKCLAGAEELPQRAPGRLLCYRIEFDRLQASLLGEYTLLLALSPLDQQAQMAAGQQLWEASLATRCAPSESGGDPGQPFLAGYRCRIEALRTRIKVLRETT
jgi:hypothetical protein